MTGEDLKFRAALSRFGIAVIALFLLPVLFPASRAHWWVWTAYLLVALFEQVLIRKRIGGRLRTLVSGLVDISVLTFTVHNLGSVVTPMSSLYLFAGVANALVGDTTIAFALAIAGPLVFDTVVWSEAAGWIATAPDVPSVAAAGPPTTAQALMACLFVTLFVPACTAVVGVLVRRVQEREVELELANRRLEELSQLDPLTNLYNRRHLFSCVETELARVRRGHALAVVMIDLDGFKKVNDAQGHLRGDVLLKEIATALGATTRAIDTTARYGGDEFMVVLPDTDVEHARSVAQRVAESVRAAGMRFDTTHPVTASLGVAVAEPSDTVAALLRRADENAYRAKQRGGDRVVA